MDKLPPVDKSFWVMKIAATTLGETFADYFSHTLKLGYAVAFSIFFVPLFLGLIIQILSKKYRPPLYWSVILLTSLSGTAMSDFMDRTLGLGYAKGSAILLSILIAIFVYWRASDQTLSVVHITTRRVETLYWITIVFSNTLGTALGDFLADNSGLGFKGSALIIGALLLLVTLAAFYTNFSKVMLFWIAFVLTRPFGATMGDFMTKTRAEGGLNMGTVAASLILAAILISALAFTMFRMKRRSADAPPAAG
jgi:uncharacterized membrane-anchored protein